MQVKWNKKKKTTNVPIRKKSVEQEENISSICVEIGDDE